MSPHGSNIHSWKCNCPEKLSVQLPSKCYSLQKYCDSETHFQQLLSTTIQFFFYVKDNANSSLIYSSTANSKKNYIFVQSKGYLKKRNPLRTYTFTWGVVHKLCLQQRWVGGFAKCQPMSTRVTGWVQLMSTFTR